MQQSIPMPGGALVAQLGAFSAGGVAWIVIVGLIAAALGGIAAARRARATGAAPISVMIIRYKDRWYIPGTALLGGTYAAIEPVAVVPGEIGALAAAIRRALAQGNPAFPGERAYSVGSDPIMRAAGLRSWSAIAARGGSYGLVIESGGWALYLSRRDRDGRLLPREPARERRWAAPPPLEEIARILLDDARRQAEERAASRAGDATGT
ncbi:MAG TPA: hypothetical protein VGE07_21175 [Herpetosiphonaceae bacterium]